MSGPVDDQAQALPAMPAFLAHELRGFAAQLRRRLRAQADAGDLTPSQTAVLLRLERDGPATVSDLARAEGMRPQSMGATVAVLTAAAMVAATPDPTDGRRMLLALTAACREMLAHGRAARQDWLARTIAARFSTEEQDELARAMQLLGRLIHD